MGNEIFEEIKKKYKESNKYMLCVSYEDIGILIQIIEKQTKEIEELKEKEKNLLLQLKDSEKELLEVTKNIISKDKIKAKIEELEKMNIHEFETMNVLEVLQSLLEKE